MQPEVAAFMTFLAPYIRSDAEREAQGEKADARRFANIVAADSGDEASAIQRAAEWGGCMRYAEAGQARAARRLAELCELGDDVVGARPWWRYAAALGDEAARLYVEHILKESPPAAAAEVADAAGAADDVSEG